jgi:hypothetical protein
MKGWGVNNTSSYKMDLSNVMRCMKPKTDLI